MRATNQFSHRIDAETVDRETLPAFTATADDSDGASGAIGQARKVVDETVVGGVLNWWRGDADQQRPLAFADDTSFLCAWNDTDIQLDAGRGLSDQRPEWRP